MPITPHLQSSTALQTTMADNKTEEQQGVAASIGRWIHRNSWVTKEPVTNVAYQYVRAMFSAVPYAFAMAGVNHGYTALNTVAREIGFTEEGLKLSAGGKITPVQLDQGAQYHKSGTKATAGRMMARFASSPMNAVTQIAAGFTLFRFVGGIVKTIRDKVTSEHNTEADTIREVQNIPKTIVETARNNWKAESNSTPWAAITLGFANAAYQPLTEGLAKRDKSQSYFKQLKGLWFNPKAKLVQNAAVFTLAYSAFFEIADRLFKDVQIREGRWPGYDNSLNKDKDPILVSPGKGVDAKQNGSENNQVENNVPLTNPSLTQDPSLGRLLLRRVIPVGIGISAYAALKRAGYLAAGGTMQPVTRAVLDSGIKGNWKHFLRNSWREGAATTTFAVLWLATDTLGEKFDKYFGKKQEKAIANAQMQKQMFDAGAIAEYAAKNDEDPPKPIKPREIPGKAVLTKTAENLENEQAALASQQLQYQGTLSAVPAKEAVV